VINIVKYICLINLGDEIIFGGNVLLVDSAISVDTYLHNRLLNLLDKSRVQILSAILRPKA